VNNARIDEPFGRIDTRPKKDTVKENLFNGGRNTLYTQKAIASYTLPLSKLPLTDWITSRYSYGTSYNWIGASRLAISLGNTIENSQEHNITGEFDLTRLYSKVRWLKSLDQAAVQGQQPRTPKRSNRRDSTANINDVIPERDRTPREQFVSKLPSKEEVTRDLTGKKRTLAIRKWKRDRREEKKNWLAANPVQLGGVAKAGGRLITMVKRASVNYSETYRSRLPGYTDSTQILGQNWRTMAPGLDYVFGRQPDTSWLNNKAANGLITRDSTFNFMFRQNLDQKLSLTAQVEPIKEFNIDLNLDRTFTKDYSELFKFLPENQKFNHLSPLATGGFNVSYIAFKTLFEKNNPNQISTTFKNFEAYRLILSERLSKSNPYTQQLGLAPTPDGYAGGYGRYSQDVLIPAFIAAYTGQDPQSVATIKQSNPNIKANPFSQIKPKPNWRVTYTGLTNIPALAKTFSTISVTHAYNGSLGMNSFTSALLYQDPFRFNAPGFIDTTSGNFIPFFLVPNITIQEQFSPLIGFDITTTGQLNAKFEYKKSRQLSLSLVDFQLSETNSTEWTVGASWRKRGFTLPFKLPGMKDKKLENDVSFRLDLAMRDDATSNSRLDQNNSFSTGGQKVYTIQPSIDYILNNRVNLKLFFDQRRVIPYISTSAPVTNTRAGLQVRISLAQ
jgi:cell surface protein SprA